MKKYIAACTLALASGAVFAGSGPFGNHGQSGFQYPVTMSDSAMTSYDEFMRGNPDGYDGYIEGYTPVVPSSGPEITSYDKFVWGNPDGYDGYIEGYPPVLSSSGPEITSYDEFMRGNPDLGYEVGS